MARPPTGSQSMDSCEYVHKVGNGLGKTLHGVAGRHTAARRLAEEAFRAHAANFTPTSKEALCSTSVGMGDEAGLQAGRVTHTRRCALREPCGLARSLPVSDVRRDSPHALPLGDVRHCTMACTVRHSGSAQGSTRTWTCRPAPLMPPPGRSLAWHHITRPIGSTHYSWWKH